MPAPRIVHSSETPADIKARRLENEAWIKRQAAVIFHQLPENDKEAAAVLACARWLVDNYANAPIL